MWRPALLGLLLLCGALVWFTPSKPAALPPEERRRRALADFRRGAFPEALAEARGAALAWKDRPDAEWFREFRLLEAEILLEQGQSARALELLDAGAGAENPRFGIRRRTLRARLYLRQSEFEKASTLLAEAADLPAGEDVADLRSETDLLRGQLLGRQNRMEDAERAYRRARQEALRAGDSFRQAAAANGLGMIRTRRWQWDEALPFFHEALRIWRALEADHFIVGADNNLGMCYSHLGEFDKAMDYRQEALRLVKPSARLAEVLGETGSLYMLQDQAANAIPYYRRALAASRQFGVPAETARWAGNLTSALLAVRDWAEAERINNEALHSKPDSRSRAFLELNAAAIAKGRGRVDEAQRIYQKVIASDPGSPPAVWASYARLGSLFLASGDTQKANSNFEQAIRIIEQSRSDLNRSDLKITFLASLIRFYQDYVDALMEQNAPARALEVADSSRARILAERLSLKLDTAGAGPGREFRDVARRSNSVWLSYWIAPRRSFLWVVTPREIRHFVLPPGSEIAKYVGQYREWIEKSLRDPLRESEAGRWLSATLIGPAQSLIPAGSRVTLLPDGPLHQLNFETLPVFEGRPHYWIEDVTAAIAPSFSVFLENGSARSVLPPSALVIGDPVAEPGYPRLSSAAAEIAGVAARFPNPATKVLAGAAAQPGAYAEARPGRFPIIHIAAHAEANPQSPLDSAVILSPGAEGFKLYARDVLNVPLKADLVTISACRSSGARTYAGEGLVGFAWAFLQVGAHSVIAGLWDVADQSTSLLMDRLYEQIGAGRRPAEALRSAKLSLIRGEYGRPYYWAPFQTYTREP
ncbi:MAG TPA: CHAT domain-containing protein [Bryobacteraceae bacterium]|nr:CHAT domain-containing protein [Bryobacteraceae bacterium]